LNNNLQYDSFSISYKYINIRKLLELLTLQKQIDNDLEMY
jgi:hypothetical protein